MVIRKLLVPLMFLVIMTAGVVAASGQEWVKLGSEKADHKADHDTITVTSRKGYFRQIKLTVTDASVRFSRMVVVFSNGQPHPVELRALIPAGGETRVIDLPGRERYIRQVDFWYESASLEGKKAKVTLYGKP